MVRLACFFARQRVVKCIVTEEGEEAESKRVKRLKKVVAILDIVDVGLDFLDGEDNRLDEIIIKGRDKYTFNCLEDEGEEPIKSS